MTHLRESRGTLVYHLDYEMPPNPLVDSRRGEHIINYLVREGCVITRQLRRPEAVSFAQLALAHDYQYLEQVARPQTLERIFGLPMRQRDLQRVIDVQRRQVAGTVLAARLATKPWRRGRPVVNLGGGLHHARRDRGAGFCLFNDVAVAVLQLRSEGYSGRILVVDLDLHHGDGTRSIFSEDETVFTFSVHSADWDDSPAVSSLDVPLGSSVGDRGYLQALRKHLPRAMEAARPELVFYVAGVDVGMEDKMGSWRVTDDGVLARDRLVLAHLGSLPMVWTLAGGYGRDAWRLTARSLAWLLADLDTPIPSARDRELRHFRAISQRFSRAELAGGDDEDIVLTPEDLMLDLVGPTKSSRLLGYYSLYGVELSFERFGVLDRIRSAGYRRVRFQMDTRHSTGERIRVRSADEPGDLLVELVLRITSELVPFRCLSIEWLLLQNPRARPSRERPLLPGQQYPGLGCLKELVMTLVMMCERLELDGLIFSPAHYHVAAQAHGLLSFLDPVDEARFAAISGAVTQMDLARATRLVHGGGLVDEVTGDVVRWRAAPMALPVSESLRERFSGEEYEQAVTTAAAAFHIRRRDDGQRGELGR